MLDRVELKEEQPVHFGMIVEYLYLDKIREFQISVLGYMETMEPMVDLLHAWLLAHCLQIPSMLNYAPWCLLWSLGLGDHDSDEWFVCPLCDSINDNYSCQSMNQRH